jgi:hypothetical protein
MRRCVSSNRASAASHSRCAQAARSMRDNAIARTMPGSRPIAAFAAAPSFGSHGHNV